MLSCYFVYFINFCDIWTFWVCDIVALKFRLSPLSTLANVACWRVQLFICVVTFPKYLCKNYLFYQSDSWRFFSVVSVVRSWPDRNFLLPVSSLALPGCCRYKTRFHHFIMVNSDNSCHFSSYFKGWIISWTFLLHHPPWHHSESRYFYLFCSPVHPKQLRGIWDDSVSWFQYIFIECVKKLNGSTITLCSFLWSRHCGGNVTHMQLLFLAFMFYSMYML